MRSEYQQWQDELAGAPRSLAYRVAHFVLSLLAVAAVVGGIVTLLMG